MKLHKVIISGGGTGGHIFPAISIADELKKRNPDIEILFVGALGKMEMEKVPQAGYAIEGLDISGFQRSFSLKNLLFPFKLFGSLIKGSQIIDRFKPQIAIGVGGYASGPLLFVAQQKGIPTLIQEQNSFPGITNKLLAKSVKRICVAYDAAAKFFPGQKVVLTGNPVRSSIRQNSTAKSEACRFFNLDPEKPVVLTIGGSLGARNINQAMMAFATTFSENNVQLLWQTGETYYQAHSKEFGNLPQGIKVHPFIKDMHLAYGAADIVISRAGALAISELCLVGKPVILVPSPYVSEDHQTKNALALVEKKAAVLVKEHDTIDQLGKKALEILENKQSREELAANIKQLGRPNATEDIVNEILKLVE